MRNRRLSIQALLTLGLGVVLFAVLVKQAQLVITNENGFYPGAEIPGEEVPVGADFMVFYGAGRIVADGDGDQLYESPRQLEEQVDVLGRDRGLAVFPYPAFVAVPYALLAGLSLPWAYVLATLAMFAAVLGALWILRSVSPTVRSQPLLAGLAILVSHPFNMAWLGGQTVAFSLLCLAGIYAGFRRERDVFLGVWLGLLLYKPQLAIVPLLLVLMQRRWRALGTATVIGAALALIGAVAAGPMWPRDFLRFTTGDYYRDNAIIADGVRSISIPAVTRYLTGTGAPWSVGIAALLCLGVLAFYLRKVRGTQPADANFPLLFGAGVAVMLLVSPHALFYEAALLILPVIALVDRWQPGASHIPTVFRQRLLFVGGLFGLGYLWPLADTVSIEPLILAPIVVGYLVWRAIQTSDARTAWAGSSQSTPAMQPLGD